MTPYNLLLKEIDDFTIEYPNSHCRIIAFLDYSAEIDHVYGTKIIDIDSSLSQENYKYFKDILDTLKITNIQYGGGMIFNDVFLIFDQGVLEEDLMNEVNNQLLGSHPNIHRLLRKALNSYLSYSENNLCDDVIIEHDDIEYEFKCNLYNEENDDWSLLLFTKID